MFIGFGDLKMLDVKKLTGTELYIIREGLKQVSTYYNDEFINVTAELRSSVDDEYQLRKSMSITYKDGKVV